MTKVSVSRLWFICILSAVSVLVAAASAPAEDYKIKLSRPQKAGDSYTISAKGSSNLSQNMTIPGAPPQKQDKKDEITLEGTIKILEVNSLGKASKSNFTISKCVINGKPTFAPGDVITSEFGSGGTPKFTVKGEAVDPETTKTLSIVLDAADPDEKIDDDKAFGTDKPQKPGDSWPINAAAIAEGMGKHGLTVTPEQVTGSGKLESVDQVDGKAVLSIALDATLNGIKPPLPPTATVDSSVMKIHMAGKQPADETSQPISQSSAMEMKFQASMTGPDNGKIMIEVNMVQSAEKTFGAVK